MATAVKSPVDQDVRKALEVKTPEELIPYLNLLIYGDPGAGKTTLAGTAQDHEMTSPMLIVDIEGGVTTLRRRKNIDVISARSIDKIISVHNMLKEKDGAGYKTVCLDSLTELQKLDMSTIMKEVVAQRPDLDVDVPSQREWGKSGERIRRIVRAYRDLPVNTIITALAASERDSNNIMLFSPALPGKLKKEIPGFIDIVGYLYTEIEDDEEVRKLQVTGTRRVVAKDRTDSLGGLVINPTIPAMWQTIHNDDE